ncbi:glycoside hydrolase family 88 protein [Paenibacillus sp. YN15]|uniref:glycoside hydrolase family 88 protein n=1 Tax=Paenibacillus sp. YN15 TaxID=1742774 RepID=UPI000DCEE4AC|nr:glycoside hydrolase family 88 protein [Paenibacillus sp. YN15]RAU93861.1 glucuronyl hydrolase [Paenibacillus sp. YN15]
MWKSAIEDAIGKLHNNIRSHGELFPHITREASPSKHYLWEGNTDWIDGFYTGMIWLGFEYSGDRELLSAARRQLADFRRRLEERVNLAHHDLGFLYSLSAMAGWMATRDEGARRLALDAADLLLERYRPKGGFIQAWGTEGDPQNGGRIIIDCLMNLPLLYWASQQTGDSRYRQIAERQADISRRFLVRGDDSSYHTFWFDPEDGTPLRGGTHQGYQDGSTWTRGQAWGIYGFALSYRYTGNSLYLETSKRLARYFILHLPDDHVAYWDVDAPVTGDTPRDSSASAIAVCGILELLEHLDPQGEDTRYFAQSAERAMQSLYENYSTRHEPDAEGLLKHGAYHVRGGRGMDDYMIWGDYYYLEAMMRLENKRPGYWYD